MSHYLSPVNYPSDVTCHLSITRLMTRTCHEAHLTPTGLPPDVMTFSGPEGSLRASGEKEKDKFILRPETAESYFVLWRRTGDPQYRDWGWELVLALEDHCRCVQCVQCVLYCTPVQ